MHLDASSQVAEELCLVVTKPDQLWGWFFGSKKTKETRALSFHLAILVVTPIDKQMV